MLLARRPPGTQYERRVLIDTNCKTWSCLACRDRLRALFKARVITGVFRTGQCAFMTLTYLADSERLEVAGCVARDWRALFRRFKVGQPDLRTLQWMRVMELTKAGTPHHHLVVGPVKGQIRCWKGELEIRPYQRRWSSCMCLAHRWSREWYAVTGDSYIVHAMAVTSGIRAGAYMAKYIAKEFDGERAKALGMARRWSNSRGWLGSGRLRLRQTVEGGWDRTAFRSGHWPSDVVGGPEDLLERNGDNLTESLSVRAARLRFIGEFNYVEDDGAEDIRATDR